jgi:hypothetical protein
MVTNSNLPVPKTVSTDTRTSQNEVVTTAKSRYTCDVVVDFENRVQFEPKHMVFDYQTGERKNLRILPQGGVRSLKEGAQGYYDRALIAEAKSDANLNRALLAESKNKTYLYGGLAGGLVIGAGVVGLFFHIRKKRREKRQKGNK